MTVEMWLAAFYVFLFVVFPISVFVGSVLAKYGLGGVLDLAARSLVRSWFAINPWRLTRVVRDAIREERALLTTGEHAEDQDGQLTVVRSANDGE